MSAPTHEEANLLLQLQRWATEQGLDESIFLVFGEDFVDTFEDFEKKYPWGSKEYKMVFLTCNWYETLAGFWVNNLISKKLIYDISAVEMIWDRVKFFAFGIRKKYGSPSIYEHFEALAKAMAE